MKLTKYIFILLLVNVIGIILFFTINFHFSNKINKMNNESYKLQVKEDIALDIDESILRLQSLFMRLPVTFNDRSINEINKQIRNEIINIRKNLNILKNGGVYKKTINLNVRGKDFLKQKFIFPKPEISIENISLSPKLVLLEKKLVELNELLKKRNMDLYSKNKNPNILIKIRRYVKTLPSIFSRMIENSNRILYITDIELRNLKKEINDKAKFYNKIEFIFIALIVFIIMIIVYIVIKNIVNLYKELEHRLYYDNLTGLKNRTSLEEEIKNRNGTLFFIDINDFKTINELYGIDVGNEVLIKFSENLSNSIKIKNNIYRVSADVFALYFSEKIDAKKLAFIIREKVINNSIFISNIDDSIELDIKVGAGIGDELLEKATLALDYAKKRNLQYYELSEKILDNKKDIEFAIEWQKKIKNGLKEDKFLPFFQPIVDKDKNIIKYEALMRLEMDVNGETKYIPPFYLDVAIKSRQYHILSKTIIGKIFEHFAKRDDEVTMNLNYLDISNPEMSNFLFDLLEKYEGIGNRITFEMLEDEHIEDYELVKQFIKRFKTYGAKLAIDDFGSGYSNFQQVLELDPDFIKIDATLIKNIDKDKASYIIVKSIVNYAKELNIKTIAEYIHSKEVFEICKSLGIDYFQGFYISKPLKDV
jgi:diguanylate cyclase (GGDEF)-like protein